MQEHIIGRRKLSDLELVEAEKPFYAHNGLTNISENGKQLQILRDNMPLGSAARGEFGTYFEVSFTKAAGGGEDGYPILNHLEKLMDGKVIWSQVDIGGAIVSTRGGDFDLYLGQDISIGYLGHSRESVTLYLLETLTFRVQTSEAVVVMKRST